MFSESRRRHKKKKIEIERTVWKVLAQYFRERNNALMWGSGEQYDCFPGSSCFP